MTDAQIPLHQFVVRYVCQCGKEMGYGSEMPGFADFMENADRMLEQQNSGIGSVAMDHDGETHMLTVLPAPRAS